MSTRFPFSIRAYRALTTMATPFAPLLLDWRAQRGKEDRERAAERLGLAQLERPYGRLAWLHGASVGETISLLPLIERITRRGIHVLVTSGTVTSAEIMARRLPGGAFHQYVPLDAPRFMARFLDHWRPDLILIAESELWPALMTEAAERQVPLVIVNGRMSERSFRRWQKMPNTISTLLGTVDLCLAQSEADERRYRDLGAARVINSGNLKFDVPSPPADPAKLAALTGLIAGRPVWLAASTHPGEEEIVLEAHRTVGGRLAGLLTIIAPRHPQRGTEIADKAQAAGLRAALRSQGTVPESKHQIYVADTMGELGILFRLSPLVFMGGSLVPHGGQNPIEPGKVATAVIHGPHVHNFADIYAALDRSGGALPVVDAASLTSSLSSLLTDQTKLRQMGRAAFDTVEALGGATERTLQAIDPILMQIDIEERQ